MNFIGYKIRATNTSGVTGVNYNKKSKRWIAKISPSRYNPIEKTFKTKEEAIAQRLAWEENLTNSNAI